MVVGAIFQDIDRLVPGERGFQIDQYSIGRAMVHAIVVDASDCIVSTGTPVLLKGLQPIQLDRDIDPEIDPDFPDCVAEVLKFHLLIAAGVTDENIVTPVQHHLVKPQVFEMSSVG